MKAFYFSIEFFLYKPPGRKDEIHISNIFPLDYEDAIDLVDNGSGSHVMHIGESDIDKVFKHTNMNKLVATHKCDSEIMHMSSIYESGRGLFLIVKEMLDVNDEYIVNIVLTRDMSKYPKILLDMDRSRIKHLYHIENYGRVTSLVNRSSYNDLMTSNFRFLWTTFRYISSPRLYVVATSPSERNPSLSWGATVYENIVDALFAWKVLLASALRSGSMLEGYRPIIIPFYKDKNFMSRDFSYKMSPCIECFKFNKDEYDTLVLDDELTLTRTKRNESAVKFVHRTICKRIKSGNVEYMSFKSMDLYMNDDALCNMDPCEYIEDINKLLQAVRC